MRKLVESIFMLMAIIIAFSACNSGETYADKLKNQDKAIDRWISKNNIVVLNKFPSDSIFAENEYYKDPETGIYIRVIDYGGEKANENQQVYLRYEDAKWIKQGSSDSVSYTNNLPGMEQYPLDIKYGITETYSIPLSYYTQYLASSSAISIQYYKALYLSEACVAPLKYVGDGGSVSLLVPFNNGSAYQQYIYEPLYYGRLIYHVIEGQETE